MQFIDPAKDPTLDAGGGRPLAPERLLVAADREWIERIDRTLIELFGAASSRHACSASAARLSSRRYLQRRLSSISRTAEAIIGGDIRERMPVSGRRDEFDQLASTLNRMLDRIEACWTIYARSPATLRTTCERPLRAPHSARTRAVANERPEARSEDAIMQVDDVLSLFAAILRIAEVESGRDPALLRPGRSEQRSYWSSPKAMHQRFRDGTHVLWSIEPESGRSAIASCSPRLSSICSKMHSGIRRRGRSSA